MKLPLSKLLIFLLPALFPIVGIGQNLTGIWRGYFITEAGENYRLEFQVQQSKSKTVTGVSYSYLDTRFYGKATMTGNFAIKNNSFTIQELRTVEVKNMGGGATCLMNYKFAYARSGKEEFLEGSYVGKTEDRSNPKNNGKWGDCGGGTVYLRKVTTSDFYVEPFLRNNKVIPNTDSPQTKTAVKPTQKPQAVTKKKTTARPIAKAPVKKTNTPPVTSRRSTIDSPEPKIVTPVIEDKKPGLPPYQAPQVTRARKNELTTALTVTNEEITIRLYDNGEIDDDTISVYLDGRLIIANKRLSATPITYSLKMDENNPEHTLVMVAENLGRIPPNTSLMIVQDGDKRYQVSITSTEQKNAMVRFRYQRPAN
ncbi:MAG TPA: hypothetical protein VJ499_02075 [Flavisolibacter sp.]|nr:hypothetical protein [Flavisolibacter sp.]